jgi:hypothetical protein
MRPPPFRSETKPRKHVLPVDNRSRQRFPTSLDAKRSLQQRRQPRNEKGPAPDRASQIKRLRSAYFCCSAGLSAGFGGLVWFCCGLAGELGFWSPEADPGVLVIVITFHEYLKTIFQVHLEAGA